MNRSAHLLSPGWRTLCPSKFARNNVENVGCKERHLFRPPGFPHARRNHGLGSRSGARSLRGPLPRVSSPFAPVHGHPRRHFSVPRYYHEPHAPIHTASPGRSGAIHEALAGVCEPHSLIVTVLRSDTGNRTAGSVVLDLVYGYQTKQRDDEIVHIAQVATLEFSRAATPGAFLVDSLPFCKRSPSLLSLDDSKFLPQCAMSLSGSRAQGGRSWAANGAFIPKR